MLLRNSIQKFKQLTVAMFICAMTAGGIGASGCMNSAAVSEKEKDHYKQAMEIINASTEGTVIGRKKIKSLWGVSFDMDGDGTADVIGIVRGSLFNPADGRVQLYKPGMTFPATYLPKAFGGYLYPSKKSDQQMISTP
jgi:hypothetical protein